jgi:hypothetical protein
MGASIKEIAKNAVRSKHVKINSLTGADVRDDALTGSDVDEAALDASKLPPGPQGPAGAQGQPGADGADGSPDTPSQVLAKLLTVDTDTSGLNADAVDGIQGTDVTQGGGQVISVGRMSSGTAGAETLVTLPQGLGAISVDCNIGGGTNVVSYVPGINSREFWLDQGATDPTYLHGVISPQTLISLSTFPVGGVSDHITVGVTSTPNTNSTTDRGASLEIWAANTQDGGPRCAYDVQGVAHIQTF